MALIVEDIGALDPHRWNELAADYVPARYEFLRATDADGSAPARYCVITERDTYLCAARLAYDDDIGRTIGSALYGRAAAGFARLGLGIGKSVVCGWPIGAGRNILMDGRRPEPEKTVLFDRMCSAVEALARGRAVVFRDLLDEDATLAGVLDRRGYLLASNRPTARIDVSWRDLDGYVEALQRMRKSWAATTRREIKRYRESGAIIERLGAGSVADWERVCELLNRHHARLNSGASGGHEPAKLRGLAAALDDDFTVYVSRQNGVITGTSIRMRHGRDSSMSWVGIDHAAAGNNFTYFNLLFYAPMNDLSGSDVRHIWCGKGAYEAKVRRGCRILPCNVHIRFSTPLDRIAHRPLFALQRAWYRRKYRRYLD